MTGAEAKEMFITNFYAAHGVDAPGWLDEEILSFIEKATLSIIKDISLVEAFDMISNLIKTTNPQNTGTDLPENYLYYVSSSIQNTIITDVRLNGEFIQPHEEEFYKPTSFHKPYFRKPKVYTKDGKLHFLLCEEHGSDNQIVLNYVETPTFTLNSDEQFTNTNEALHEQIIELSLKLASRSLINTEKTAQ